MQELQDHRPDKSPGKSPTASVAEKAESANGKMLGRGTGQVQEGQKHCAVNFDAKTNSRKSQAKKQYGV